MRYYVRYRLNGGIWILHTAYCKPSHTAFILWLAEHGLLDHYTEIWSEEP